jgi:hypothetical protein
MSDYMDVVVETYPNVGGGSSKSLRARPVSGQGLDVKMNVECSSKMRKNYPVGTKFLIAAKLTNREGGSEFLYSHFNSPYKVLSDEEANEFVGKYS